MTTSPGDEPPPVVRIVLEVTVPVRPGASEAPAAGPASRGLHPWLERNSNWRRTVTLLVAFATCSAVFQLRHAVTGLLADPTASADDRKLLDGRKMGYRPDQARKHFEAIGPNGCTLYAETQFNLDGVFPLVYGLLLCDLAMRLGPGRFGRVLVWVPVAAVCADYGENTILATQALGADWPDTLLWVATGCTVFKWAALAVWLGGCAIGAVVTAIECARGKR